jgi:hypothetical protein
MRSTILPAAAIAVSLISSAEAEEFAPNHLFVTSGLDDRVFEFDTAGLPVRTIEMSALGLTNPGGLAFSPRGTLFVASLSTTKIVELDPSGAKVSEFDVSESTGGMQSIAIGPDGHLYIGGASFRGFEVRTLDGVFLFASEHANALYSDGLAIGADGGVWTVNDGSETIQRWGTPNQQPEQFWVSPFSDNAEGVLAFDGRGRLHVPFVDGIHVYNGSLTKIDEYATVGFGSVTGFGLTVGPDGNTFLGAFAGGKPTIFEFDSGADFEDRVFSTGADEVSDLYRLAFAPFRFAVAVEGKGTFDDGAAELKENGASLTYFPGAGRAFVQFDDVLLDATDFSSLFGSSTLVFQGFEHRKNGKSMRFGATQSPIAANTRGQASIALEVKGKTDPETGFFAPTSAKGTLHRAGIDGAFAASIRTKKQLK